MRLFPALVVAAVGCLALLVMLGAADVAVSSQGAAAISARESLAPPKLFNFLRFKALFKKKYNSITEELARKKIFLAKAFKAFLSFVSYKHSKSNSYMKLNDMSDMTQAELRQMEMSQEEVSAQFPLEEPAADLEEIDEHLRELMERRHDEPGFREIAAELRQQQQSSSSRKKRDIPSKRSSLTLDYLLDAPSVEKPSHKSVLTVPSNNPQYEQPELSSFGVEDSGRSVPLSEQITAGILNSKGASFIGGLLSGAANLLLGNNQPQQKDKNPTDETFFDLRTTNCFTPVKHQRNCGSCYIFSTVALYEWQYCIENNQLVQMSEQYPLDCGGRIGMDGCHGGQETEVADFFWLYGIELESKYPYWHKVDTCPYEKDTEPGRMGYLKVHEHGLKTIPHYKFEEYIQTIPILLGIGVSDDFHDYGGGVDMGEKCNPNRGHSVLVVGSGREDGVEYWLIRNSYGSNWGENGYYKLSKEAYNCFLSRGIGWILEAKSGKVFDVNSRNDGKAVLARQKANRFVVSRILSGLLASKQPNDDPSVATPKSV